MLTARTAVVTGASRGIGLAVARTLADEGLRVLMLARDAAALRRAAAGIPGPVIPVECDVSDESAVASACSVIRSALGDCPDVLVNNAGAFTLAPIEHLDPAELRRLLEVNLVGPARLIREFLPDMRRRGSGTLVNVGSVADHEAFPGNAAYAASKFGLRGLHAVMRRELRGTGVRCVLVSPGPVDTPLWDPLLTMPSSGLPSRSEMLTPEDVAAAVRFAVGMDSHVNIDVIRLSRA